MIKVIVLSDNREGATGLGTEHGLSVYVETDNHKLLLDTGASDLFLRNAQILDVDLSAVDYVFISHGHRDHIGGLPYFLEMNEKAKVIVSPHAITRKFVSRRGGLHDISLDFDLSGYAERMMFVHGDMSVDDELRVFSNRSTRFNRPFANKTLFTFGKRVGLFPDPFNHELILTLNTDNGFFVFTGCAHNGLLNILETVTTKYKRVPRWVMGGFHLLDSNDANTFESEQEVNSIVDYLNNNYPDTQFLTGHCTGEEVYSYMKKRLELPMTRFYSGFTTQFI